MADVEHAGNRHRVNDALRAATLLCQQATKDRHMAIAHGARSTEYPEWLLASLTETWSSARAGSLNGRISIRRFRKIDEAVASFLIATLGFDEVNAIAAGP